MKKIYLDNAASTKTDKRVIEAMIPFLNDFYGNPSSIHSFGKPLKVIIEDARDIVANFLGVQPKQIFFTSGGTESNNFSLKGLAFNFLGNVKNHIISTTIEHPAVIETLEYLRDRFGFKVTFIKPPIAGIFTAEDIESAITKNTFLISVMHSNNETGIINEIENITKLARNHGIYVHSDTVQSIGKAKINFNILGVDFATLSAHKIYGPKGVGLVYIKDITKIDKYIHGGGQERNLRGGTENVSGIVGLKKAIELLEENIENDLKLYAELNNYLIKKLLDAYGDKIYFNSLKDNSLYNIVNISFDTTQLKFAGDMMLIQLDLKGIAVSGGSACSSGSLKPSRILLELGRDEKSAMASLRISFGRENTKEDVDYFMSQLKEIINNSFSS